MFTAITKDGPAFESVPTREWATMRARATGMAHDDLVTDPNAPLEGRAWRIEEVEDATAPSHGEHPDKAKATHKKKHAR